MHTIRVAVGVIFGIAMAILAIAAPSHAAPATVVAARPAQLYVSGVHANEVEPLVRGLVLESAHVLVFATCFLALADNDTCVQIAGNARARLE